MTPHTRLMLYSLGVIAAACAGGVIPLWSRERPSRLDVFFAASAGVMLAILGGHMLPEAFKAGPRGAWSIVAGFLFMLVVERFVLPHALHSPQSADEHVHCDPEIEAVHVRADAAGIGAFLGLALHTVTDGLALGASLDDLKVAPFVLAAIIAHKVPTSFALSSILVRARVRVSRIVASVVVLGAMVGFGAGLYLVLRKVNGLPPGKLTPYAVGFSAGSFLHVAVTDLLPDLHIGGRRGRALVVALLGGLVGTILLSRLMGE